VTLEELAVYAGKELEKALKLPLNHSDRAIVHCTASIVNGLFAIATVIESLNSPSSTHTSDGSPGSTESTAGESTK
jgi:hypothetical protein